MAAIAQTHQQAQWSRLVRAIADLLAGRGAHAARTIVLVPYAQLMPVARRAWAAQVPDGFAPRFETTMNWACPRRVAARERRPELRHGARPAHGARVARTGRPRCPRRPAGRPGGGSGMATRRARRGRRARAAGRVGDASAHGGGAGCSGARIADRGGGGPHRGGMGSGIGLRQRCAAAAPGGARRGPAGDPRRAGKRPDGDGAGGALWREGRAPAPGRCAGTPGPDRAARGRRSVAGGGDGRCVRDAPPRSGPGAGGVWPRSTVC